MPVLSNARHEKFAQALAAGMNATEAYAGAGYKGDRTAASRLSTNVNIGRRVRELQSKAADRAEWSAADRLKTLSEIVGRTALTDPRVAVSAISEANKMQGSHAPAKNEHSDPGGWSQAEDKTWRQVLRSEKS
jgi:phage terminase small subunit